VADGQPHQRVGQQFRVGQHDPRPHLGDQSGDAVVGDGPAQVGQQLDELAVVGVGDDDPDHRFVGGEFEEQAERGVHRGAGVVRVDPHRVFDLGDQVLDLPGDVGLDQGLSGAELVVHGLPADPGDLGDVRHGGRRPPAGAGELVDGVDDGVAQQSARGLRVGDRGTPTGGRAGAGRGALRRGPGCPRVGRPG
jgi:hypothetical protein